MSADDNEAEEEMSHCASCGKPENDDIKLRKCTACYLVRYCGVKCQKDHWKKHKRACKKRVAELRDELLFKQPESTHIGDCPICCLPLPLDPDKSSMMPCCSKLICIGCDYSNQKREIEGRIERKCAFCRHLRSKSKAEADRILMKRAESNDPVALRRVGSLRSEEGDYKGAIEYIKKAAEMGDAMAHYQLSYLYNEGKGVEKDEKKDAYHLEQAAIGGHPDARYHLGFLEGSNDRFERAARHWIIAANLGHDDSMEKVKEFHEVGMVSKDDFASTLRAHHAAVDAMKSPQREAAEADVQYQHRM